MLYMYRPMCRRSHGCCRVRGELAMGAQRSYHLALMHTHIGIFVYYIYKIIMLLSIQTSYLPPVLDPRFLNWTRQISVR
jgi:hypothetical protein